MWNRLGGAVAAALVLAACGKGGSTARECPSEAEAHASIQKHVEKDVWSDTERYIWKVNGLSDFTFGPGQFGHIVKKQVEYGREAQDVCPVRLDVGYKIAHADGRIEPKTDSGKTYLFYRNGFDEWVFKTE